MDRANIHRLVEALLVFDCYRVIIMQRPPSLSWLIMDTIAKQPSSDGPLTDLRLETAELARGAPLTAGTYRKYDLATLTSLIPRLWPAVYPRHNSYGAENRLIESLSLWNTEPVELACEQWFRTRNPTEASHLVIYHMMHLVLHANTTIVQSFAHSAPESAGRDSTKSSAACEISKWTKSIHYETASWHAEAILATVEKAVIAPSSSSEQRTTHQGHGKAAFLYNDRRGLSYETPHVPYAIYYATLVLWCGAFTAAKSEGSAHSNAKAIIMRGERAVSLHKVHIAQLLAQVLREIG